MILSRAGLDDLPRLIQFRTNAAAWLRTQGSDQWAEPFPAEHIANSIKANTVYLLRTSEQADAAATITLDEDSDDLLWLPRELQEPALFVHKLTVDRRYTGLNLGTELLNWASTKAAHQGKQWVRLDAWTTNRHLQQYYERQGFQHVRTVHDPLVGGSGWVAQRRAAPAPFRFEDLT
ncbi:GNAT family N-acetyltransferase [Streptomyces fagopyri]|uniref:GNAT family N-acetyltransferase n=1 Tax=Streptomyces fagopyri TaxID=2662397 RepID=UPI00371CE721